MPPAFSGVEQAQHGCSDELRLACQVKVYDDIELEKFDGFWGQKVGIHSTSLHEGTNYFKDFNIEYIMDTDSVMGQKLEVKHADQN